MKTVDFRKSILEALESKGRSRYWLAQALIEQGLFGSESSVYYFLSGANNVPSDKLAAILSLLDIELVHAGSKKKKKRRTVKRPRVRRKA